MIDKILKHNDLWTYLKHSQKPVLLYGMGDGADKVLDVCNERDIKISGVFASDGFSRNKVFRSFEVTDYTTAKQKFKDFTVLLSFASSRDEVIENILRINGEQELFCPDVPVFGDGVFDSDFVEKNFDNFLKVYNLLSDEKSKENYVNLILGKMTGNINYLISAETTITEAYDNIIQPGNGSHYVDIGAYNGDTIREFLSFCPTCSKITAFEPDMRNFRKLCAFADENALDKSSFYNIAAWDCCQNLTFYSRSGRNSAGTTSHKNLKSTTVSADAPDKYISHPVDYINIDAEGSDRRALLGLKNTIAQYKPVISCAIYHRNEDFYDIPLLLTDLYGECELYIRHFTYFPAWDTNVYAKPKGTSI